MQIKNYSYIVDDYGNLNIYIYDLSDKEYSLCSISCCENMSDAELEALALEEIEIQGYELV